MKIKKFLETVAEEDRESLINDKDIEFLASIGVDYNKKREAAKKEPDSSYYRTAKAVNYKALLTGIACFLVVAITVITLSLYFSLRPAPAEPSIPSIPTIPPIQYFDDNFVDEISDLQHLNEDLELFALKVNFDEYDVDIKRTYDSLSGDNLYYTLDFVAKRDSSKRFKLDVVVNKFYTHEELAYTDELKEVQFFDYTLKYYENSQKIGPLITVNCKGEIQLGEQCVYVISYNERTMGQSTFIATLESLIQFK